MSTNAGRQLTPQEARKLAGYGDDEEALRPAARPRSLTPEEKADLRHDDLIDAHKRLADHLKAIQDELSATNQHLAKLQRNVFVRYPRQSIMVGIVFAAFVLAILGFGFTIALRH